MDARLTLRRALELCAVWLAAWLCARETLTVLFAFHPLRLLWVSLVAVLLLSLWLRTVKSRLIGLAAAGGAFLLLCLWPAPADGSAEAPFRRVVTFFFDFADWLRRSASAAALPEDERFGAALWLTVVLCAALLAVLLLRVLRAPVCAALVYCALFTVLQVLPVVQDRCVPRLLLTEVAALGCCALIWSGRRWDRSRKTRSYAHWQRGMALLLLPALLLTALVAGGTGMGWHSARFSGGLDGAAERVARLFATGGSVAPADQLHAVALGGARIEYGSARFDLTLDTDLDRARKVYLRTAVFAVYDGRSWSRLGEDGTPYPSGTDGFYAALQSPADDGAAVPFTITDVRYATTRLSVPLGTVDAATALLTDVVQLRRAAGNPVDFAVAFDGGPVGRWTEPLPSDAAEAPGIVHRQEPLPAVALTATPYGELDSAEPLRRQSAAGLLSDRAGTFFDDGVMKPWRAELDGALERSAYLPSDAPEGAAWCALPATLPAGVRALAQRLRADTPYRTAVALRDYLMRSYSYTLTPPDRPDADFVDAFLFDLHAGYCTSFASAMTVLARCCGIPARYVEGYAVEHADAVRGVTVTDREKHAWAELYFEGAGWLTFDATSFEAATSAPVTRAELAALIAEQSGTPDTPDGEEPDEEEPDERDEPEEPTPDEHDGQTSDAAHGGVPRWVRVLLPPVLCAALALLWYRLRQRARAWALARYRTESGDVLAAYRELCRCAGALGCVHATTQTVDDYFTALAPMGLAESSRLQCARAARAVNAAAYGGREPERADRAALCDVLEGAYRRLSVLRGEVWLTLWWRKGRA